ncbi:MAG: ABC transporter permease, partial [Candidatus Glassbacteria bacterium]|nr:ABC transporter permease [Candidatus Glassbacteria bacterium]
MLSHYLKVAMRNLLRHKGYSAINITGLGVGLACCLVIALWVRFHLSFDNFQARGEQVHVLINKISISGTNPIRVHATSGPVGPALKADFPEIVDYARCYWLRESTPLKTGGKKFKLESACFTDPSFFDLFSFSLVAGDPASALSEPDNLVLTEETAQRLFGGEDPVGKVVDLPEWGNYRISGVLKNPPENSTLRFDALLPIHKSRLAWIDWDNNNALA